MSAILWYMSEKKNRRGFFFLLLIRVFGQLMCLSTNSMGLEVNDYISLNDYHIISNHLSRS